MIMLKDDFEDNSWFVSVADLESHNLVKRLLQTMSDLENCDGK